MKAEERSCEIPGLPTDTDLKQDEFIPVWPQGDGRAFAGKAFAVNAALKNIDQTSAVNLTLPKAIYGVTGVELVIRLDNLFLLHDKSQVKVDIMCEVGSCENRVWRYTADRPGRYHAQVEVADLSGRQLGIAETEIVISDIAAGNDQNISMLMIGDSLLAKAQSAGFLLENMNLHGNKNFTLIGSHSGAGAPLALGTAAVEAYGGWRWAHFLEKYTDEDSYRCKSKFLRKDENGKLHLDFGAYLGKYYQGRTPDIILVLLGCNDIAHASMDDFSSWMEESRTKRRQLLEHIRAVAPSSIIGLVTLPPANSRHKAYLENYHGVVVHQQYRYNQLTYVKELLMDYQDDPAYSIIPIFHGIDSEADYPEDNSIHPNDQGYRNFALAFEAWIKAMF